MAWRTSRAWIYILLPFPLAEMMLRLTLLLTLFVEFIIEVTAFPSKPMFYPIKVHKPKVSGRESETPNCCVVLRHATRET
jgi:hypothetical protein